MLEGLILLLSICYREFCGHEMPESKLNAAVRRLNYNVLQLCFTQRVLPEVLHPKHTIHNVLMLLQATKLGRYVLTLRLLATKLGRYVLTLRLHACSNRLTARLPAGRRKVCVNPCAAGR